MLAAVEAGDIFEVVWVSLLSAVIVCIAFSLVVLGGARSAEARRERRSVAAFAYGAFATLFFVLFAGGMVFAVHIMLTKSAS